MSDLRQSPRDSRRAARAERRSERTGIAGAMIVLGCGVLLITG
jgi:hypothetical protein